MNAYKWITKLSLLKKIFLAIGLLLLLLAVPLANWLIRADRQRQAVRKLMPVSNRIVYDYQLTAPRSGTFFSDFHQDLRRHFGSDLFSTVVYVYMETPRANNDSVLLLHGLPMLKGVSLSGGFGDTAIDHLATHPNLETASLTNTKISSQGLARLQASESLKQLTLVGTDVTDDLLSGLVAQGHLESLSVLNTSITPEGVKSLLKLSRLKSLSIICMRRSALALDENAMQSIAAMRDLESLTLLNCNISSEAFQSLELLGGLEVFCFLGTGDLIGDLRFLAHACQLKRVELRGCLLEAGAFQTLGANQGIEHLVISDTNLDDKGLAAIAQSSRVQTLDIRHTHVTLQGILRLSGIPNLKQLSIGPGVSDTDIRRIKSQMPGCHLIRVDSRGGIQSYP